MSAMAQSDAAAPVQSVALSAVPQPEAAAEADVKTESWGWHWQATNTTQKHGTFTSPYSGPQSLLSVESAKETLDTTLFLGARVWKGGEFYLNPEFDQGYGLENTLGVAGFTSGDAYKVGHDTPYARLHRAFLRQTFSLDDGPTEFVESSANNLAGTRSENRITLTLGKISVPDLFDGNAYAHDPRADFLNWTVIEAGAFDYAADSWGFSSGAALEWAHRDWTLRGGFYAMSKQPNMETLDGTFKQQQWLLELERHYDLLGHPGAVRVLGFLTHARMGLYTDAVSQGLALDTAPNTANVRQVANKTGYVLNLEQELAPDVGAFARYSANDGKTEAYDFTDINQALSGGVSIKGSYWNQPEHRVGLAFAVNGLSSQAKAYFAAGGMGILIGDGQLPHYGTEQILEAYYSARLNKYLTVTGDYQFVKNPAYNEDRGPVSVWGLRLHAEL
ncbi:MAG: carbohydrate porin [Burkholderiaceae bacterium]|nr:carbohydrate porin [Burkholderiaceae bacterium]